MKLLIAEDDNALRLFLEKKLTSWGYDVISVDDGKKALQYINNKQYPDIAILDWMMPETDGIEVCSKIRQQSIKPYIYIILLTARDSKSDISQGFEEGADDYMIKPFDVGELHYRIKVGERIIRLERQLESKISELKDALSQVKQLKRFLPICSHCKKIRNDDGYWQAVEGYIHEHTSTVFSHSICPECANDHYPGMDLNEDVE